MMSIEIENQKVIEQIVGTFARKPKTHIEHIRISDSREDKGYQIARILYYDGRQRRYGKHNCCADLIINENVYLRFYCCNTKKIAVINLNS